MIRSVRARSAAAFSGLLVLTALAGLPGCATSDAQYPWPDRVVRLSTADAAALATSTLVRKPAGLKSSTVTVIVKAHVDETGAVKRVAVVEGSGYPDVDTAALRGVAIAKFSPQLLGGRAEAATVIVPTRWIY